MNMNNKTVNLPTIRRVFSKTVSLDLIEPEDEKQRVRRNIREDKLKVVEHNIENPHDIIVFKYNDDRHKVKLLPLPTPTGILTYIDYKYGEEK